jgi:hypothetical protein
MKKALLIAFLVLLIVSCGKKGEPYPKDSLHHAVKSGSQAKR